MEIDLIKDLTDRTTPRVPKKFTIEPDTFQCAHKLPAGVVQDLAEMRHHAKAAEQHRLAGRDDEATAAAEESSRIFFGLLDIILYPESGEVFAKRMRDPLNPIDMADINRFMSWTIEEYSDGRPTTPSSGSSTLPTATGTSSTDGAPTGTSTPLPSPLPVS